MDGLSKDSSIDRSVGRTRRDEVRMIRWTWVMIVLHGASGCLERLCRAERRADRTDEFAQRRLRFQSIVQRRGSRAGGENLQLSHLHVLVSLEGEGEDHRGKASKRSMKMLGQMQEKRVDIDQRSMVDLEGESSQSRAEGGGGGEMPTLNRFIDMPRVADRMTTRHFFHFHHQRSKMKKGKKESMRTNGRRHAFRFHCDR